MILALGEILFDELPGGRRPGGAPFNFAQHLHRLGHDVRFVSSVGRDSDGDELLALISDARLDADFIQRHPEAATGRVAVTVDASGIPTYDIVKNAAYDFIDFDSLPPMEPEMVYFGSLIQRTPEGRDRLQAYLSTLPDSVMRLYDVNFRDGCVSKEILVPSLEQTDILKLNDEELPMIGKLIGSDQTGDPLVEFLIERFSIRTVALTCGPKGCALYRGGVKTDEPPGPLTKEDIVDTVGAGDSFAAMLAHGILNHKDANHILRECTKLAEYVCTIAGAVPTDDSIYNQGSGAATKDPQCLGNVEPQNKAY